MTQHGQKAAKPKWALVAEVRQELDLSLEEAAVEIGMASRTLRRIEDHINAPANGYRPSRLSIAAVNNWIDRLINQGRIVLDD